MCLQVFDMKVQYFQSTPIWTPPNWTTPNWNTPVWTDVIGLMGQYNFPTPTPTYTNLHPPMGLPTFIFLKWAVNLTQAVSVNYVSGQSHATGHF